VVKRLAPRLEKLEATTPKGCPTCRLWHATVLQDDDGATDRPERCPHCRRLVPIRTRIHLVRVPLDAL
jgi:hypothetical protein